MIASTDRDSIRLGSAHERLSNITPTVIRACNTRSIYVPGYNILHSTSLDRNIPPPLSTLRTI